MAAVKWTFLLLALYLSPLTVCAQSDHPILPRNVHRSVADLPLVEVMEFDLLLRAGRIEEAVVLYDVILARQPDWVPALMHRARLLDVLGRTAESRRDVARAQRLNPVATGFYSARSSYDLLPYLALFPTQELEHEWCARFDCRVVAGADQPLLVPDLYDEAEVARSDLPAPLKSMLYGNLALLRQDLYQAVQHYNDADLNGGSWPELYYNRGLAEIMLHNLNNGCADLQLSVQRNYDRAGPMLNSLCTF